MQLRQYQNDLVEQLRQSWREGYKAPCIVLPCGGGKSCILAEIARRTTQNDKRVLFLVHRRELVEQIASTFVKWGVDMRLCDIIMVQTAVRRLSKIQKPALIITDENHHSTANTYKKIYDHFSDVLRVGVTATPVRLGGSGLGDVNDKLLVGVSAKWLIENNCLSPYDYYAPNVADLTGLHTRMGEFKTNEIEAAMIKKAVFGDVVAYYKKLADGKKAICYCASIKHSKATAEAFRAAGIQANHIDGDTPKEVRRRIINDFRNGKIQILCNVDLISEGFDVPDCECAILLRPTQSLTLYIQQSMRCMRYVPQKRAVIIDHVGNYARFGLPDDDREWSLEGKKKKSRNEDSSGNVRMCAECFRVYDPKKFPDKCPFCGCIVEKQERKELKQEDAPLEKIEGFKLDFKTADDCRSYRELLDYAKHKGYKPGWAFYQAKQRGFIHDRGA